MPMAGGQRREIASMISGGSWRGIESRNDRPAFYAEAKASQLDVRSPHGRNTRRRAPAMPVNRPACLLALNAAKAPAGELA